MYPKTAPIAKELSMKAVDFIRDKASSTIGDRAGKAFSVAINSLARLIRKLRTDFPKAV